jgi:hypothetical protein
MSPIAKLLTCAVLLSLLKVNAQDTQGILIPKVTDQNSCQPCLDAFKSKPRDVHFNITNDNKDNLYFEITDPRWLKQLFTSPKDGFIIDIVDRERYTCNTDSLAETVYGLRGTTTPFVMGKKLITTLNKTANGRYSAKVATIPKSLKGKTLEFNIYFVRQNFFCYYSRTYNLKSHRMNLLDPGLYLDALTYASDFKKPNTEDGFNLKNKTLKFVIPFKKNKATYSKEDIAPLYDSLQLTKFDIKKIKIKAYASVEGSTARNATLQKSRANSIIKALQNFQKPTLINEVESQENWVEFYNDIAATSYADLTTLNKQQIKAKLQGNTSKALEKYLKNHRKAVVELELEKKDPYQDLTANALIDLFAKEVAASNVTKANSIHNVLVERLKNNSLSPDRITELTVPDSKPFLDITIKNTSIPHLLDIRNGMIVYEDLLALDKKYPRNKKIKYNIVATKFVIWRNRWAEVDPVRFKLEIKNLKNYGVSSVLIKRLLVNYNIIQSQNFLNKGDYKNKDLCIEEINNTYKHVNLKGREHLNLAQFFVSYSRTDLAYNVLDKIVRTITVDEDVLFYYLNLTIVKQELTKTKAYRTIMLNALAQNKSRFCNLFNQYKKNGGITFQLLEDEYLRRTYCENCNR